MDDHDEKVKTIALHVHQFHEQKTKFRIYHGSTNSTRTANFDRDHIIDTSGLTNVLSIDKSKMTALVEPNVPLDKLVESTLPLGLVPPVVMEFPGITVGGGFSGTSAESSSFRHGLFEQTIVSIEVVLADGTIMRASQTENEDLLHGAAGAFGTLGVLTLLEIKLIEAQPYVELTYHPCDTTSTAITIFDDCMADSATSFLDGILFSPTFGVVMQGRLAPKLPTSTTPVRFTRRHDPWFYLHAQSLFRNRSSTLPRTEYIPLTDYLFRYDRGAFWTARYAFAYFLAPFNRISRTLLDPLMRTRVMYRALHASGLAQRYLVQDLTVPVSSAPALVEYTATALGGIWPLWLCPLPGATSRTSATATESQRAPHPHLAAVRQKPLDDPAERPWLLNVGVWGPLKDQSGGYAAFVAANRDVEAKVRELGGVKTLYAHAYYTETEFEEIYNADGRYEVLREKFGAKGLPSVYDKVRVDEEREAMAWKGWRGVRPLGGLVGVVKAILGREYLIVKAKRGGRK